LFLIEKEISQMRLSLILLAVVGVSLLVGVVPLVAQEQDDVRGAFLTSRPKDKPQNTTQATTRPPRKRPKPAPTPDPRYSSGPAPAPVNLNPKNNTPTTVNRARIGVGITLFMRDSNGLAVRTDPSHVFRKGDRVRILLETNTDGFLYIFNTTNDGPPVMIYPQVELDEGGNYLQAHVPFEIPSSLAEQERLRWLVFDEVAGDERLFFVFTKEPLQGIPIEEDLIAFCKDPSANCPLRAPAELWAQVQVNLKQPRQSDRSTQYGLAQTSSEKQATTRGMGLAKTDPEPSLIMMASSNTSTLVTSLDLIHK
jgi:hypothetical protein